MTMWLTHSHLLLVLIIEYDFLICRSGTLPNKTIDYRFLRGFELK